MSCAHCCMSATEEGEDMSLETFKACLSHEPESISLGGGEPTLNPNFEKMLFLSLGLSFCEFVWLASNGSMTETSIVLANMARSGILGVVLSQDDFHDPIDPEVIEAFTQGKIENHRGFSPVAEGDLREIRNVGEDLINSGRCDIGKEGCACDMMMVHPNGDVYACGCDDSPEDWRRV